MSNQILGVWIYSNQIPNQLVGLKYQIKYFDVSEMISQTKFMTKYLPQSEIIGIQILSFKALNGPTHNSWKGVNLSLETNLTKLKKAFKK